jgi:hypothetical protein
VSCSWAREASVRHGWSTRPPSSPSSSGSRCLPGERRSLRPRRSASQRCAAVMASNAPVTDPMTPFDRGLGLVLPEWPVVATPAELEPGQRRLLALEGVVHLLRAVIATTPGAVLIADDLHAADPESTQTIRYVATELSS